MVSQRRPAWSSLGRSLAVTSHAICFADPRHGIHSPGFRSYEDDGMSRQVKTMIAVPLA